MALPQFYYPAPTPFRPKRQAFTGSSIAVGSSSGAGSGLFNAELRATQISLGGHFAFHVARNLSARAITVAMPATGGAYISSANNAAAAPWLEWQLPRALANRPDVIHINIGTNECGGGVVRTSTEIQTYRSQLQRGMDLCMASGVLPIFYTIPPRSAVANDTTNVLKFNEMLMDMCFKAGLPCVDFYRYVTQGSGAYVTNMCTEGTPIHPDGTALGAAVDAMMLDVMDLFPSGAPVASHSLSRSTAAAPTDNLVPGLFHGIGSVLPTNWARSSGADINTTISSWAPSGANAAGQKFIGNGMSLANTAQYTARSTVQDLTGQVPRGAAVQFAAWFALPTNANAASRAGLRFALNDAGSTPLYRSALLDGMSGTFATPTYIAIEVVQETLSTDGATPVNSMVVDIGHHAAVTANSTLQVANLSLRRVS